MKRVKIILLIVGILFLVGCARLPSKPSFKYIAWQERQAKLKQNKNWVITGALSVTNNNKRNIAYFEWKQNEDNYTINISGPMNLGRARITGDANQVEFCQSNRKCVRAKFCEQLFLSQFGWRMPISNMRYWVLGLPASTKIKAKSFDLYGHLVAFEQQEWKINYSEFQSVERVDIPGIIELWNKKFFIKLKIKNLIIIK